MRRLLVLRPEPGASATVERARALGLDAVATPLFEIEPVEWSVPDPSEFDALLLTSANAVRSGGEQLHRFRALPVHAVGAATAEAARNAGFTVATTGEADLDQLVASLQPQLKLLHLCGEHRKSPDHARQQITQLPVYRGRALAAPDLAPAGGCVVLIHSPRAGGRFAELAGSAGLDRGSIAIAAISPAAAEAAGSGWERIEAAAAPTDAALLALAARLCNNRPAR